MCVDSEFKSINIFFIYFSQEHKSILAHYEDKWVDYKSVYDTFPLAVNLKVKQEMADDTKRKWEESVQRSEALKAELQHLESRWIDILNVSYHLKYLTSWL